MTEVVIHHAKKKSEEVTYKIGDWFMDDETSEIYVLAKLDQVSACLISSVGNRYTSPAKVNNLCYITEKEFAWISAGDSFTKLSKVTITCE